MKHNRLLHHFGEKLISSGKTMRQHPEIDYVSRDRGKDYTQGASEGAPQAIQVADRFHLMKNLVEAIEPEVSRCYSQPRRKRQSIFDPYAPYVLSRWQQGFKGSLQTVYRFVKVLRQEPVSLPAPSVLDRVAVQKAIWLLARPYENLKANERTDLQE